LTQANLILAQCRSAFPDLEFELRVFKTTGDKLQSLAPDHSPAQETKGLFTKELEAALHNGEADLAVHSLKDLPTDLPEGLKLGAVSKRADVRDVLIYRDGNFFSSDASGNGKRGFHRGATIGQFPPGATIATSSTRRQAQLLALNPAVKVVPIRGNVGTRLRKLADRSELDGLVLAAAGLERLGFKISSNGSLTSDGKDDVPGGLLAMHFSPEEMLPCVGQAALGIEMRAGDERTENVCTVLNDLETYQCVTAERAFLRAMGGGCLSPVAAYGDIRNDELRLRAVSFRGNSPRKGENRGPTTKAEEIGIELARQIGIY